jgi:hypothetical protein
VEKFRAALSKDSHTEQSAEDVKKDGKEIPKNSLGAIDRTIFITTALASLGAFGYYMFKPAKNKSLVGKQL